MHLYFIPHLIREVPHVDQELIALREHRSSPPVFIGVRVAQSLVFCLMFYNVFYRYNECQRTCSDRDTY
jgi:hypothetical protein